MNMFLKNAYLAVTSMYMYLYILRCIFRWQCYVYGREWMQSRVILYPSLLCTKAHVHVRVHRLVRWNLERNVQRHSKRWLRSAVATRKIEGYHGWLFRHRLSRHLAQNDIFNSLLKTFRRISDFSLHTFRDCPRHTWLEASGIISQIKFTLELNKPFEKD